MGLLFLGNERQNLVPMVEEVTEGVEDLGFRDPQGLGDLEDRLATPVQRNYLTHSYPQPIDHRLATADVRDAHDMWMLGFDHLGHG
jgi:hypothetical protein